MISWLKKKEEEEEAEVLYILNIEWQSVSSDGLVEVSERFVQGSGQRKGRNLKRGFENRGGLGTNVPPALLTGILMCYV